MKLKQVAIAFTFYFVAAGFKLPDFENATNLDIGLHIIYDKLHRDLTSLLLGENQYQNDMVRYLLQNSSDKMCTIPRIRFTIRPFQGQEWCTIPPGSVEVSESTGRKLANNKSQRSNLNAPLLRSVQDRFSHPTLKSL